MSIPAAICLGGLLVYFVPKIIKAISDDYSRRQWQKRLTKL